MSSMTTVEIQKRRDAYEQYEQYHQQYDSELTQVHDIDELLKLLQIDRSRRAWSTTTDVGASEF